MIEKLLFGVGAVMIVEGLVYLLAPNVIKDVLKALDLLSIMDRRKIGALMFIAGFILVLMVS
ncbi:MAG: DUF2065 family protein [Planktomarina sp.]|nr:DUF2065 family protein [Planktomarina sp.]MDT2032839.1 DUF2065 family protein [Planktomarina sp.]MDT2039328.1 DUF2065 family protein [Planktomarina sp.]MDT2049131.1 DUF2065 family protein [Planktomarina sp.]